MKVTIQTESLYLQEAYNTATRNIYGITAYLLLNITFLVWSGGLSTLYTFESGAGNLLTTPMRNSSNPFENSSLAKLENQENDASQTITFNPLAPATYGDPVITLSATASSGLPVTFESDDPTVAIVSGNLLTIVGAGATTITASQEGDATYDPAMDVSQVLTVNKATLTATSDDKTKIYGDIDPSLTISYTGFKGNDNATVIDIQPTVATIATQFSPVDSYDISFMTGGTDNNYSIVLGREGFLTISKADLEATVDNKTKIYGDPNPLLTISYSGFKGSDDASDIDMPPSLATDVTQFTQADEYSISFISEGIDNNYEITPLIDGILTITKSELAAKADDKSRAYGQANPGFTITYTGFKGSDNASNFDTPPLLTTNATQSSPVGSYNITFLNDGLDNNYEINSFASGILTITIADQNINFSSIEPKVLGSPPFELTAAASSGLPVTYQSNNTAIATINGNLVTMLTAGSVTITASQSGNDYYNAAEPVSQTFCVNPAKPTITVTNNNSASPVLNSSASSGNQWYLNGEPIPAATNSVLTADVSGVYTVKVKVGTCESVGADPVAAIITGDIKDLIINIDLHPNPVEDRLEVEFNGFEAGAISIAFVDPLGRIVESQIIQTNRKTFDLFHFAPGNYWILATQAKNRIAKQFIKK